MQWRRVLRSAFQYFYSDTMSLRRIMMSFFHLKEQPLNDCDKSLKLALIPKFRS